MQCTLLAVAAFGLATSSSSFPLGSPLAAERLTWLDYDADGLADALVLHPTGRAALFANLGAGQFEDATNAAGLTGLAGLRQALAGDFDGDGLVDLVVVSASGNARLLQNRAGTFTDVTEAAGIAGAGTTRATWRDFDGDGWPDLVLEGQAAHRLYRNVGGAFEGVDLASELLGTMPAMATAETPPQRAIEDPASDAPDGGPPHEQPAGGSGFELGAGTGSGPLIGPGPASTAIGFCASRLRDQASGTCLEASSVPALGMLYPLGTELSIDAATGRVGMGTTQPGAALDVGTRVLLDVQSAAGSMTLKNSFGLETVHLLSEEVLANGAQLDLARFDGTPVIVLDAEVGTAGWAELSMRTTDGTETVQVTSQTTPGTGACIELSDAGGTTNIELDADASGGALVKSERFWATYNSGGFTIPTVQLYPGDQNDGRIDARASNGIATVHVIAEEASSNGAQIDLSLFDGTQTIVLDAEVGSGGPELSMRMRDGTETVEIRAEEVLGNGAQILLRKSDGSVGIILDAEQSGDGRITTEVLQITGGADLVESFDTGDEECLPGSVLVIDPETPGELTLSTGAYDSRVAGIVSGAGGIRPGLHMGQEGVASGDTPVALSGRVYVRCSTENGSIAPGDLLTTASRAGHAMKATDRERSFGAVIGKAMSSLEEDTGLVLVLVGLQ